MALSDMKVFNDFVYMTVSEVVDQEVQKFNAASQGTITLTSKRNTGDYAMEASFAAISGLVRRRNAYGSGSVNAVALSMIQNNSVKVAGGTPPIKWEPQQLSWIQQSPEKAGVVIGTQLAKAVLQDQLNSALGAAASAVRNVGSDVTYTVPSKGTLTLNGLNFGAAKFGDRSQGIKAWVMHSKPLFDLYDAALTNSNRLFEFGTVQVRQDGMGRVLIVTDSPNLAQHIVSPDVYDYVTLGLVENAISVEDNDDFFANTETSNGQENIERTYQAEWTFNLALKGYTWDINSGSHSPTDAYLKTGTNWDKTATSIKDTLGVAVVSR